ncbi:A24 family peptidase [Paludibaculum fermentans]|uniref:Prepilin peptidase n=1 Tax=Paludibaculum fermentans TaxID=1473598 RepID=A0A7S7NWH9_PALFE|nr:prepilin peptidase [Paludibaculum fermentans]QOY91054.1 prepilin peptidase [Paludibaculum fermentans]
MTLLAIPVQYVLAAVVLIAAACDIRSRNIPNWLSLGGVLIGLALHPYLAGWTGLKFSAGGLGLAVLMFVPLFVLRWLGGGDVKLMAAVGALAGAGNLFIIFIMDAILGGAVALIAVLFKRRGARTLRNIGRMITALFRGKAPYQETEELEAGSETSMGMPRAVTIALATLLVLWATPKS